MYLSSKYGKEAVLQHTARYAMDPSHAGPRALLEPERVLRETMASLVEGSQLRLLTVGDLPEAGTASEPVLAMAPAAS